MVPNHAKQNISFFHKSLFCGKFVKSLFKIDKLDIIIPIQIRIQIKNTGNW